MKYQTAILLLLGFAPLDATVLSAATNNSPASSSRRVDLHFARSAPYATPAEATRRLGLKTGGKRYALATEKFQLIVPGSFTTNATWGLLVWISPGDTPGIPPAWDAELTKQQLLCVSAYQAGNQRDAAERARLAVEAAFNLRQTYKLDPRRIYVAGFSGGGRVASMVGMGYPEVFTGTLCVCGVGFYTDISTPTGEHWPHTFKPEASLLAQARQRRFVLLTGDQDINREITREIWRHGFEPEGFRYVRYLEVPGMKHALPSAEVLGSALAFLAGKETQ